jgi:hypothetical protein
VTARTCEHRSAQRTRAGAPLSFKVVDVATGAVLAQGAGARATVDLLTALESIFDAWVYVRDDATDEWRQLTVGEQRTLWSFRGR